MQALMTGEDILALAIEGDDFARDHGGRDQEWLRPYSGGGIEDVAGDTTTQIVV